MTACVDDSQGPNHQIDVDVIPSIIFDLDLPVAAVIRGELGALVVGHASQGIPKSTDQVALLLAHDKLSGKHSERKLRVVLLEYILVVSTTVHP